MEFPRDIIEPLLPVGYPESNLSDAQRALAEGIEDEQHRRSYLWTCAISRFALVDEISFPARTTDVSVGFTYVESRHFLRGLDLPCLEGFVFGLNLAVESRGEPRIELGGMFTLDGTSLSDHRNLWECRRKRITYESDRRHGHLLGGAKWRRFKLGKRNSNLQACYSAPIDLRQGTV